MEQSGPKAAVIYSERHWGHAPFHTSPSPEKPERIAKPLRYLTHRAKIFNDSNCILLDDFKSATEEDVLRVHDKDYVNFIRDYSGKGGGFLGDSTYVNPNTYSLALLAAGGAIHAGEKVNSGEVEGALALIRPPGHHASRDKYGGYCIFNNAAILARYMQEVRDQKKVMIIDWDAHAGNGTMNIFYDDPSVFTISIHREVKDFYPHDGFIHQIGTGEGRGYSVNVGMPQGSGNDEYMRVFEEIIIPLYNEYKPDFLIGLNGFDAHFSDKLVKLQLTYKGYYDIVYALKHLGGRKITILMEGGYNVDYNCKLSHCILNALMERETPYEEDMDSLSTSVLSMEKTHLNLQKNLAALKLIISDFHDII